MYRGFHPVATMYGRRLFASTAHRQSPKLRLKNGVIVDSRSKVSPVLQTLHEMDLRQGDHVDLEEDSASLHTLWLMEPDRVTAHAQYQDSIHFRAVL